MKIAILNIYNGLVERGSEVFVTEFAQELSKRHEVCVFQAGSNKGKGYSTKIIKGISYKPNNWYYSFLVFLFTIKCLPVLWRGNFDCIIPVNGVWQAIFCRILRLFKKNRIVITGHAGIGRDDYLNIKIGNPDVFIAISPQAYHWAKKLSPKKKIYYIPNGINPDEIRNNIIRVNFPFNKPVILCVSALLGYKRIDLLIRAVSKLEKTNLLIIGDGPKKDEIQALGKKLLGERFFHIPRVNHKEIGSYYKSCDVFSLPSKESEAFGLVYLEALSCNIPVVAPDDINRRTIIGNAGLYCDVGNIEEYAQTLHKALETDFYDKPVNQAKKYSWNEIVMQYEKIL